jgi:hypothetical protein
MKNNSLSNNECALAHFNHDNHAQAFVEFLRERNYSDACCIGHTVDTYMIGQAALDLIASAWRSGYVFAIEEEITSKRG